MKHKRRSVNEYRDEQFLLALDDAVVDAVSDGVFKVGDKVLQEWGFTELKFKDSITSGIKQDRYPHEQDLLLTIVNKKTGQTREYMVKVRPKTKYFR